MRKFFVAAAIAAAALIGSASSAEATFQLRITTSSGFTTTLSDLNNDGQIDFNGAAGANFTVTVSTALSKPLLGSEVNPNMDLVFVVVNTTGNADTITIESTDQGFEISPIPLLSHVGGTVGTNATLTAATNVDNENGLFGSPTGFDGGVTHGPFGFGAFSDEKVFLVSDGAPPYSLTQKVVIATTGISVSSGDLALSPAPAPAGLVIALTGMPMLGLGAWLRRRRTAVTA
jgi:hypothetical protein